MINKFLNKVVSFAMNPHPMNQTIAVISAFMAFWIIFIGSTLIYKLIKDLINVVFS